MSGVDAGTYSSGLKPVALITGPQVAASDLIRAASSAGRLALGTMPNLANTGVISGLAITLAIASAMRFTTGAGVPAGANNPNHSHTTISFTPCSAKVATSG